MEFTDYLFSVPLEQFFLAKDIINDETNKEIIIYMKNEREEKVELANHVASFLVKKPINKKPHPWDYDEIEPTKSITEGSIILVIDGYKANVHAACFRSYFRLREMGVSVLFSDISDFQADFYYKDYCLLKKEKLFENDFVREIS